MGYEKPSAKLTFYKAFFSSQWKFLVHTILQSLSAKRTSWNEFSSAMASAHVEEDTAAQADDAQEPSIPSPTPPTPPPQPPHDLPSTSQEALDVCDALTRRVEHLEYDKVAQALEITMLKRRVKKLEKGNRVKVLKLRKLKKVETSQRIDTSEETVMDDASNQVRMIDEMDKDDAVALMDDKEEEKKEEEAKVVENDQVYRRQAKIYKFDMDHASKVLSMQEDESAEVQEVVDVVTTTKLITEVVAAASETITVASTTISAAELQVPAATITAALNVAGFRLDYFKGMSYDDIRPIFEAKFNLNIEFLLKTKEQMEEEESRVIQSINETSAQKAAKRRKLNEEVKDLKRHLEIVPDEDDDVYTKATPLARKSVVKERFSTSKPNNFSNDFLLTTLGAMFERLDGQAQVWKNQRTVHGQAKVKS
nr:hypothetical protein [Tanacetum cinerariifolium]